MNAVGALLPSLLPSHAVCRRCGETASSALKVDEDGQVICRNCADRTHSRRHCTICARDLPCELHHVASRRAYPSVMTPLCLNCHAVLYPRQYAWRRGTTAQDHPFCYLLVGVLDLARLNFERSPAADAYRLPLPLVLLAVLVALGLLRCDAVGEVGRVFNLDHDGGAA